MNQIVAEASGENAAIRVCIRLFLAVAMPLLVCGCEQPVVDSSNVSTSPASTGTPTRTSASHGGLTVTNVQRRNLEGRPIDLALAPSGSVSENLTVSQDRFPIGRADLPWLSDKPSAIFSSAELSNAAARGEFDWEKTPYWSASVPAWAMFEFAAPNYVSMVLIRPHTPELAYDTVRVSLLDEAGSPVGTAPVAEARVESGVFENYKGCAPIIVEFRPKLAKRVKVEFLSSDPEGRGHVYISEIRVLGHRGAVPPVVRSEGAAVSASPAGTEEDLARLQMDEAEQRVCVSQDKAPNGYKIVPWLEALPPLLEATPYWAAAAPCWAEVDLGGACVVDRVEVTPWSAPYGVRSFYVKVITPGGEEVDPRPSGDAVNATGDGESARLTVSFEPVRASKVKLYFTQAGTANEVVYVHRISVYGRRSTEAPETGAAR